MTSQNHDASTHALTPPTESPVMAEQLGDSTEGAARNFPCESCGADLTFNIGLQSLACPYCGHSKNLTNIDDGINENDFREAARRIAKKRSAGGDEGEGLSEVSCESCGSTVRFAGTLTSSECAYCVAPIQLEDVHDAEHRIPVDGLLPFGVTRESARQNLGEWVQALWFAPNNFKKRGIDGKFSGVYLPFWTYDSMTYNEYVGERGEHYYVTVGSGKNRRTVRKTRWYPVSGSFQRFFDDVLVVGGKGLPDHRLDKLEPWPLSKCIPFNKEVLAGFLARTYDVDVDAGFFTAKTRMAAAIEAEVRRRIGGDTQRIHSLHSAYNAITYKHLLLPVWMMTYRYDDKPYQVVVNACTGEVQGDRPYSWIKITLAVLAGAAAIAGMVYFMNG